MCSASLAFGSAGEPSDRTPLADVDDHFCIGLPYCEAVQFFKIETAVLVAMGFEVHAIELEAKLVRRARRVLDSLSLSPTTLIAGDGRQGLPNQAPFDGIIAAACADGLPSSWKEQTGPNGRLVAPVETSQGQVLRRFDRVGKNWNESDLCNVLFVPLR